MDPINNSVESMALEVFFQDTMKKLIQYCRVWDVIPVQMETDNLTRLPTPILMDFLTQLKDDLIPKGNLGQSQMCWFMSIMLHKIEEKFCVPELNKLVENYHCRNHEIQLKIYRYFECMIRISCEHKKILTKIINREVGKEEHD